MCACEHVFKQCGSYQGFKLVANKLLDLEWPLSGAVKIPSPTIKAGYISAIHDTHGKQAGFMIIRQFQETIKPIQK